MSFARLPVELTLCIGSFLDDTSLRSLRATCHNYRETFTPSAFRTFFVRHRSIGFNERIAYLKNGEPDSECAPLPFQALVQHARVLRIEMGDSIVHQGDYVRRAAVA
jgi:hypothetical protein